MNNAAMMKKIRITGEVVLASPLLIGGGDGNGAIDVYILKDKVGRPFIPATSLAGVLRAELARQYPKAVDLLFGADETGAQSAAAIEDILLRSARIVLRDGVAIDAFTGVAIDGAKYDYEAVERGATGKVDMTITLRRCHEACAEQMEEMARFLADQLAAGICVGALTAKGFGRINGRNITVGTYDFAKKAAVQAWLLKKTSGDIYHAKAVRQEAAEDFVLTAEFALCRSLIVRDQGALSREEKDAHIHAVPLESGGDFVIPGTAIKGALRQAARRILREIGKSEDLLEGLVGFSGDERKQKSRLYVDETYFKKGVKEAAQAHSRIDRFTGAVMRGALFKTKPVWQEKPGEKAITLRLSVRDCKDWEAGLLLFLLKDLWTGRLALGGEKAIGRGILTGIAATIHYRGKIHGIAGGAAVSKEDKAALEGYAEALHKVGEAQ